MIIQERPYSFGDDSSDSYAPSDSDMGGDYTGTQEGSASSSAPAAVPSVYDMTGSGSTVPGSVDTVGETTYGTTASNPAWANGMTINGQLVQNPGGGGGSSGIGGALTGIGGALTSLFGGKPSAGAAPATAKWATPTNLAVMGVAALALIVLLRPTQRAAPVAAAS